MVTLVSWDGEEYGLLGSVEFVERHAALLRAQTVAYINVDFGVKGTHKLLAKGKSPIILKNLVVVFP